MTSSKIRPSLAFVLCIMMVLSAVLPVLEVSGSSSRNSARYLWSPTVQLTNNNAGDHVGQAGIDSSWNLHCVWVNYTGTIYYGKTDRNGTFLVPPKVLGTSNRSWDANPRLSVDTLDNIHITWSNNTGPDLNRTFEYVRLNISGSPVAVKHGAGGDALIGYSTGFMALRFFNASGPSVPAYGPLSLLFYDTSGSLVKNLTVGYHKRNYEQASMTRKSSTAYIVFMMNETVMNLTSVQGTTMDLDQKSLLTGRAKLASPQVYTDDFGALHLLWIDHIPNPGYTESGIYHMKLYLNGTILQPATFISGMEDSNYSPTDLALVNTNSWGYLPILSRGSYTGMGSSGDEIGDSYLFIELRMNGTVLNSTKKFMNYCSKNTPAIVQFGLEGFYMFWGERACWSESGGGTTKIDENLYFRKSMSDTSVDLAVSRPDITFPARTFPDEDFSLNVTVHNLRNWSATAFTLNLTDKTTAKLLGTVTRTLDPLGNTTFGFIMNLHKETTLLVFVDPLSNHDVNMSNNMVEGTITPVARPDLAILADNITFSNVRPNKGQSLEVSALISNLGGLDAGADVLFFDGVKGIIIGKTAVQFNTSSTTTSIFWAPSKVGVRTVIVRITNVTPYEPPGHSSNNEANRTLLVGSQTIPSVQIIAPAEQSTIELGMFNITGIAWDPDNDDLEVYVRVDGGPWEQAATVPNATIKGVSWNIKWDFYDISEGNHTIGAQVKDDIHQNDTHVNFLVGIYLIPFTVLSWSPHTDPTLNETQNQLFEVIVDNPHNLNLSYLWTLDGEALNQTSRLNMTTTYDAAGTYNVTVTVSYGNHTWRHSWKLTVKDVNRPPVLVSHSPQNDTQTMRYKTTTNFEINVTDPDGDVLTYNWTTGGKLLNATKGWVRISFIEDGDYFVNVTVTDNRGGMVNHSWMVHFKYLPPPCCTPPPKTHTYLEDMFLVGILVIGGIIIVLLAVIYVRYNRLIKGKKGKGDTELGESPIENELSPAGHVR